MHDQLADTKEASGVGPAAVISYTDDCTTLSDLRSVVGERDFRAVVETSVDVGYICKRCSLVFLGYGACAGHQGTAACYPVVDDPRPNTSSSSSSSPPVKLVQTLYECAACRAKCSTVADYRLHCESDSHRIAMTMT